MTPLECHGRIAHLCDADFKDWRLNIDQKSERRIVSQPDWPLFAAGLADVSGGLGDLPDEASDEQLLELVRHGLYLYKSGIITEQQVVDARNAVLHDVVTFGEAVESQLSDVASNN